MKIYFAYDHAGYAIRNEVINLLQKYSDDIVDLGAKSDESVDYPDFGHAAAKMVAKDPKSKGVIICGTGIGISISANKIKGIRAALCHDAYTAKMSRMHNDANILAFGQRVLGLGVIEEMIEAFFSTSFEGGRHERRVRKIEEI